MSNPNETPDTARSRALVEGYYTNPARGPAFVRGMFNGAAQHYNFVNHLFSLGSGGWYRRFCLRRSGVKPGALVVDVATGTGLLAREALALTRHAGAVIGVDVSEAMLAIARRTLPIPLIQATAEALPLASGTADFITMAYALRHITNLEAAFAEALRVLRPGGAMVLLEVSVPRHRFGRALAGFFIGFLLPRLSFLMTRDARARTLMQYHWQTILHYMPPDVMMNEMRKNGFERVTCQSYGDLFHHYTGRKPL